MPQIDQTTDLKQSFDVTTWLAQNCGDAGRLLPEAIDAVSGFTLMWNMFEGAFCQNGASATSFEEVAERVVGFCMNNNLPLDVGPFLDFWRDRYQSQGRLNALFDGLNFRRADRRELVELVIQGKAENPEDQILALLIIIYRLRNNLFHGLKTIAMLNDQIANLNNASRGLAYVMEYSDNRLAREQFSRGGTKAPKYVR